MNDKEPTWKKYSWNFELEDPKPYVGPVEIGEYVAPIQPKKRKLGQKIPKVILRRAKNMRNKPTFAEKVILMTLRGMGIRFRCQEPINYGRKWYIMDFFLNDYNVCLEADGTSHRKRESEQYDKIRDERLATLGIRTARIENEYLHNFMQATYLINKAIKGQKGEPK